MKREEYEERMKDSKYRELAVTTCEDEKDYVFISYRGDSWRKVLTEIVYKLQKEYGLRVYFDKEFASETNIWVEQFIKNMDSSHCKAFLGFFDEGYVTSYATLLELMHAMNPRSKLGDSIFPISFPINWKKLDDADRDTGLGTEDPDNPGWEDEKRAFEREFRSIKKKYPAVEDYYYEGAVLRGCDCKDIMAIIQPKNKREYANEEAYYNQFIVAPLKKKCPEVFEEIGWVAEYNVVIINDKKKSTLQIKEGNLIPKQDPGIREGFKLEGWFVSGTDKEWDFANPVDKDIEIYARWEDVSTPLPPTEGLWKYSAKQVVSYLEWDGESKNCIVKKGSQVAAEAKCFTTLPAATLKDSLLKEGVIVGDKFVVDYHCDKISKMINVLYGGSVNMQKEIKDGKLRRIDGTIEPDSSNGKSEVEEGSESTSKFEYLLWNEQHSANKLTDLMHDVFDLIAEKYPNKIRDIADCDNITAVARKDELDQGTVNGSKASQFAHYKSKEHLVNGVIYCVNAGYNREGGVGQLKKMLVLCEGNSDGFRITKAPEKSTHSGSKSGKKGLGEILN